ncbi:hypothetical protein V7S43_007113 [Phytophthora oleae]|uniref:Uncharacterized protein n=1 Tax=Phytophthora oleae TaxID=2107226 RepID=A0ABD3FMK4_9STRA
MQQCNMALNPLRMWKRLQVSYYGGKYSVERALALETYTKETSPLRVLLVCIGSPLPMIVLVMVQELIPLQDPTDGWYVNYGFWLRSGILAFVVGHTITGQTGVLIDGVAISTAQLVSLSALAAVLFIVCAMALAAFIFPVPFFVLTLAPLFYALLIISVRLVVGGQVFRAMRTHSDQSIRYIIFVSAQVLVAFVYPTYESLFHLAKGTRFHLLVILLLPVIKVAVKNLMLRCTTRMEDMVPEAVLFTVDFFNATYIATCMQSASSVAAIAAITVTDLVQTGVMLYGFNQRTVSARRKLLSVSTADNSLLAMAGSICRNCTAFKSQSHIGIRIRSCLPHRISEADQTAIHSLEKIPEDKISSDKAPTGSKLSTGPVSPTKSYKRGLICWQKQSASIYPVLPEGGEAQINRRSGSAKALHLEKHSTSLCDALEVLFTTECVVITAYLEAVVPLFYCNYVVLMVNLPSAQYHSEMNGVSHGNIGSTVLPVFVFGLLQILSFALIARVIRRNLGMHALYQLAFVLETQMSLIQGKLMLWMVITICFRVVHFGMDFTYQFSWIK